MTTPIEVTARDPETGQRDTQEIVDDYVITCAGTCYIHHVSQYANGTHVITIKGRKERQR